MSAPTLRRGLLLTAASLIACSGDDPNEPPGPVATVEVSPGDGTLPEGLTLELQAIARDSAGQVITGRRVTWSSTNMSAAKVDTTGTVVGIGAGSATIVAAVSGKSGSATITVTGNPVTAVEIAPAEDSLKRLKTLQLTAVPKDALGRSLQGKSAEWAATGAAIVDQSGLVSSNGLGPATITATVDGIAGSAEITVYELPLAEVVIDPRSRVLVAGDSFRLSWELRDAEGDPIASDAQPDWASSNPAVGVAGGAPNDWSFRAIGPGTTTLSATVQGVTGSEQLTVISPPALAAITAGGQGPCALTGADVALCWEGPSPEGWPRGPELAPAFTTLEAADGFACGLTSGGIAECWGERAIGLGRGTPEPGDIPEPVAGGRTYIALSASASHACAVTAAGAAYCWGLNSTGQLGAPSGDTCDGEPCSLEPVAVAGGLSFRSISAGAWHTCALNTAGKAWCWGRNANGELGDGTFDDRTEPTPVQGSLTLATISAGGLSGASTPLGRTCALTTAGEAYCWGRMTGDGSKTARFQPTAVAGGFHWQAVTSGARSSCGIVTSGDMYCWGDQSAGQLGTGNTAPTLVPALVAGGHTWTAVDGSSRDQNCGLTIDGVVYCWGAFAETKSFTPVKLLGQP